MLAAFLRRVSDCQKITIHSRGKQIVGGALRDSKQACDIAAGGRVAVTE